VNQTRLAWVKPEERQQIINQLAHAGVKVVRVGLQQPFNGVIEAMGMARQQGLDLVLNLSLNVKSYYDENVAMRDGGRVENAYPLSTINVARFRTTFSQVWAEIERRNIKLLAVEVGNEINWAFNGDVAARNASGRTYGTASDVGEMPAFLQGLDRYIELLKVVQDLRNSSRINRDTLVITAGMARVRPEFAASVKADVVDSGLTLSLLAERGLNLYADAAAMHQYPVPSDSPAKREEALAAALQDCGKGQTQHACWMTEWGVSNNAKSCPLDDGRRAELVRETRQSLRRAAEAGKLAAAFYFEWSGTTARSIWRCGGLTEAGVAAIQPDDAPAGTPR
jgi:hypothetical protein